ARHGDRPAAIDDGARRDTPRIAAKLRRTADHDRPARGDLPGGRPGTQPAGGAAHRAARLRARRAGEAGQAARPVLAAADHPAPAADGAARPDQALRRSQRQGGAERSAAPRGSEDLQGAEERPRARQEARSAGHARRGRGLTDRVEAGDREPRDGRPVPGHGRRPLAPELQLPGRHHDRPDQEPARDPLSHSGRRDAGRHQADTELGEQLRRRRLRRRRQADREGSAAATDGPWYESPVRKVTWRLSWRFTLLAAIAVVMMMAPAQAQPPAGGDEDLPAVQLSNAGVEMLKLALPKAEGDGGEATATMSKDMDVTGLFQLLDPASFPAQLQSEGLGFSSALWSQVGAQAVIKMKVAGNVLEGRVYIVARGDNAVLTKSYRAADVRDAVHAFANDVVKSFTGQPGVFGSRIALAMTGHGPHEIAVVDMDGGRTSVVTKMGSDSLLPAFSPTGGEIAFTSYLHNNPDLYVVSSGGGRARRVSKAQGLNTGAAWAPGGHTLALTMSYEGNSDIYRIDPSDGRVEARLTNNPGIDSSPCFSPDGGQIAFVS